MTSATTPARPPSVLIASSEEGLPYARTLKEELGPDVKADIWDEGFFRPGEFTLESFERHAREYDGAIVLATADDRVVSRAASASSPRDNLLLEFGLLVAVFGRRRALLVVETVDDLKLPSDVAGLTYLPFKKGRSPKTALKETVKRIKTTARQWRDEPLDKEIVRRIDALLGLSIVEVQAQSGITSEFGLHVFVVDKRTDPPRLLRVARRRLGPKSPKSRSFAWDEGVVGTCWRREESVFADFSEGSLRHATEVEWTSMSGDARYGMDWELLSASRTRYKAVGAVPISSFRSEEGFVGCVAYNLGRASDEPADVLQKPAVVRVLDYCAESMAIVLGSG